MRSIVVLMLAVGVGLTYAGAETWIGVDELHHYKIADPKPGVFPPQPDVFRPAADTFKYDDNMAANAWAWNYADNGWGVKFISPSDNITVAGMLFYRYGGWPSPGGDRGLFMLYADDGTNGSPGTQLWISDTVTGLVEDQWNYIPVNTAVIGTNYYLFYVQVDSYPNCPGMPLDAFNNAPSHRMWQYSGDGFSETTKDGEWMIRSVVDWTPQDYNAAPQFFASNMPKDTVPDISIYLRAMIKNLGMMELPAGTPVRLHITGPSSYTYDDTMMTTANLVHGQTQQMNFSPPWHIPAEAGEYVIKVWTDALDEQWPADDTITYELSAAQWIEYCDYNAGYWIHWGGPQRAVQFNPADFGLTYPVGLSRVRAQFFLHSQAPWPDSSFQFKVYGDDGFTLLWEGDTLEAPPGMPGLIIADDLDSMLLFESGGFYVAVDPIDMSSHPSSFSDDVPQSHSFFGSPGAWGAWANGEYLMSAAVAGGVGIVEEQPRVHEPSLAVVSHPNPVSGAVTIRWQVPVRQRVDVGLYDATGRLARSLYGSDDAMSGAVTLDTKSLAAGIYLVRVVTPGGTATQKLVLEH